MTVGVSFRRPWRWASAIGAAVVLAVSASASAATSEQIPITALPVVSVCTELFEVSGHMHIVSDNNKLYITINATGIGLVSGRKYVAESTQHQTSKPAVGDRTYVYQRFIRSSESGPTTGVLGGGDDFYLRFEIPGLAPRMECK